MVDLLVNYLIVSCVFNIPYYYFNLEDKVFQHIRETFYAIIKEMERKNPYDPRIREILDNYDIDATIKDLKSKPVIKLVSDMVFFPFNLMVLTFILFDKMIKR